jgi:hypothetical protein
MRSIARLAVLAVSPFTVLLSAGAAEAVAPPCNPCAGVEISDPAGLVPLLAGPPKLAPEARLHVAHDAALDGSANAEASIAIAAAGATPWTRLVFRTPSPLTGNPDALKVELDAAAALARKRPARANYQVLWSPANGEAGTAMSAKEYAFLIKRASVAVTGEDPDAQVVSAPLPTDPAWLTELYGEDVAAYLDAVALGASIDGFAALDTARQTLAELDPGKPLVLDGLAWTLEPLALLPSAAEAAEHGFALALFDARQATIDTSESTAEGEPAAPSGAMPSDSSADSGANSGADSGADSGAQAAQPIADVADDRPHVTAAHVRALTLLANEFLGDLSFDATTRPEGAQRAWSFVRGEDLSLRVIAEPPPGADRMALRFPDPGLKSPALALSNGEVIPFRGGKRTESSFEVGITKPRGAIVLRVERASAAELEGVERGRREGHGREPAPDAGRGDPASDAGGRSRAESSRDALAGGQRDDAPLPGRVRSPGGRGDVRGLGLLRA